MFYYSEQRYTIYNALFALTIHRWIFSNNQLFLQKYLYDTIRDIHTGRYVHRTLRVHEVYGYLWLWDYMDIMWLCGTPIMVPLI